MDAQQYKLTLEGLKSPNAENLHELAQWAENECIPWTWAELGGIVGEKKLSALAPPHTIRQGLQVSFADREQMPLTKTFYIAQLSMFERETKRHCEAASRLLSEPHSEYHEASIYQLHSGLYILLLDGLVLLEQGGHALLGLATAYGAWHITADHPFAIFKGTEQIIYGQFSGLTHVDRAPLIPVALLRTALEIRLRSAFGIQAYINPTNKSIKPIDMRSLFEEIKKYLAEIDFAIDFHDLNKIYGWTNPYLHSGWRDFVWVPGYVLQFLRPLFADPRKTPDGLGWNINGGIRMALTTWRIIRQTFEQLGTDQGLQSNPAAEANATCLFL
jgi:hypothetical protein